MVAALTNAYAPSHRDSTPDRSDISESRVAQATLPRLAHRATYGSDTSAMLRVSRSELDELLPAAGLRADSMLTPDDIRGLARSILSHRTKQRTAEVSSTPEQAVVPRSPAQVAVSAFSLIITTTPANWAAHCDSGCGWEDVTFSCPGNCSWVLNANGVATSTMVRADSSAFAFELHRADRGMRAKSLAGTEWKALSWYCAAETCRARIDAHGVRVGWR